MVLNVKHGVHGLEGLNGKALVATKLVMLMGYMESPKWFNMINGKALGIPIKPIYDWLWIVLASMVGMTIPLLNGLG